MSSTLIVLAVVVAVLLVAALMAVKIVGSTSKVCCRRQQGRAPAQPGLRVIVPFVDVMHRVLLRIVTMPIQCQGIITRDNVRTRSRSPQEQSVP